MAKEYQFNWRPPIPPLLQQGTLFDKYDDDSTCLELNALVKIDEYGFFFHWQVEGRDSVVIDLAQIWEVRRAGIPKDGRVLFELEQRGPPRETLEDRTLWITHGQDLVTVQSIYLVAQDVETAKVWRTGINEVLRVSKIKHVCAMTSLQKHWTFLRLSLNERKKIPLKNMIRLFASGKPEKMVHKCLCDLGLGGDKYIMPRVMKKGIGKKVQNLYKCRSGRARKEREELDVDLFTFDKFLRLYHKICPRTDVQELFVKLSGQKEYLTKDRLINFLNEEQRDPRLNEILFPFFDNERVQQLIAKYEQDETYIANGKMSGDGFLRFLLSDENAPVFLDRIELCQEMDQPLCHYYINSSHNTYLTGRQYGGKSSAEIYRQVLLSGCRCIELDCWDGTGENKGEPIITHGKAMCTDVFFRDVLYQIRDTAFARSDFPVILSFENHCSKSNQLKMAKYCMEIFGDMLLSKPFDDVPLEPGAVLPSPNRLKRKILIKNKRLKPEIEKHQLDQFLREGKLDEDEEITETPEVVGEDSISPQGGGDDTSDEDDPSVQSSNNVTNNLMRAVTLRSIQQLPQKSPRFSLRGTIGKRHHSPIAGDQRAHPERDPSLAATVPQLPSATSSSLCLSTPSRAASSGDLVSKEADEAHPELKQSTFISKLKPLGFAKKQELDVFDRGLSDKRSFRYNGPRREDHSDSAALLDPITRTISARGRRKPILTKEEEERIFAEYHYTGATTNIHPLLSSLVNYTHPVKFSGFDVAEMNNLHFHMSSFSESTGLGYLKQFAPEFVNYNKRQLSRIYPKGARVDSSNFLPQIFWNAGCQMVSLNFQTPDVYMQLNQGKFEYNGNSGYLLKPDFMRRPDRTFDPFSESPVDGVIAAHCSVRVISGQFVCERKVGTYVEVEMYGLPTDTIRKEHRTKIIPGNGLNPVYNEEPFVFRKVVLPELAVLRFAVYEDNGRQLGQRILPLDGLQSGYRHISLRTETNLPMCLPFLFVHIVLKTYVPDELSGLVDALADPRAYLTQQQKRQEALHHMGVEDSDIVDVLPTKNNLSAKNKTLQKANGSSSTLLNDHSQPQSTRATDGQTPTNSARPPGEAAVDKFKGGVNAIRRHLSRGLVRGPEAGPESPGAGPSRRGSRSSRRASGSPADTAAPVPSATHLSATFSHQRHHSMSIKRRDFHTERLQVDPIEVEDLRKDKSFVKLKKKHIKDMDEMKKKQQKQRESCQKQQQTTVDKLLTDNQRSQKKKGGLGGRHAALCDRISDPKEAANTQRMRSLVSNQTDEWSSLMRRHETEEFEMRKNHIREEFDLLRKLMLDAQKTQMTALKTRLEAENKELRSYQTKKSMEDSSLIKNDKGIKTKAEKDRRVKELQEKNLKLFVEERRRLAMKAQKHEEQLAKRHQNQVEELDKEAQKAFDQEEANHKEEQLASRPESVV